MSRLIIERHDNNVVGIMISDKVGQSLDPQELVGSVNVVDRASVVDGSGVVAKICKVGIDSQTGKDFL